jgi:hypothetical protein
MDSLDASPSPTLQMACRGAEMIEPTGPRQEVVGVGVRAEELVQRPERRPVGKSHHHRFVPGN